MPSPLMAAAHRPLEIKWTREPSRRRRVIYRPRPISPLLDSKDGLVSNRLDDLHSMGLTHQEAVVYTSLLSLGPSHARAVYKDSHLTREDTFRILRGLEAKALVQVIIGKPSIFVAIEP